MLHYSLICAGFRYKKQGLWIAIVYLRGCIIGDCPYICLGVKARRKGIAGKIRCWEAQRKQWWGVLLDGRTYEAYLEFRFRKAVLKNSWIKRSASEQSLYNFLPDKKGITCNTLSQWQEELRQRGYSSKTINMYIATANFYLAYIGHREYQLLNTLGTEDDLNRTTHTRLIKRLCKEASISEETRKSPVPSYPLSIYDKQRWHRM